MSNETDTRLTEACNKLSEVAQQFTDISLSLNAVVNDYISADQEREDKIRKLEEKLKVYEEDAWNKRAYGG